MKKKDLDKWKRAMREGRMFMPRQKVEFGVKLQDPKLDSMKYLLESAIVE
jgi:hypothetical protein